MKKLLLILIVIACSSCRTTKIDHKTGDRNPTWTKVHLDKVHKQLPWYAGNDLITPDNLKPVKVKK